MDSRVLFVDDDAAMRDVVGSVLAGRGFEVVCMGSGTEAMATGSKTLAAGILQFDRKTFYRKLQSYGIT